MIREHTKRSKQNGPISRAREAERLFNQFRPMALRIADKFAFTYKRHQSEMIEQAESLLGMIVSEWTHPDTMPYRRYRSGRGSESGWIYKRLHWDMIRECNSYASGLARRMSDGAASETNFRHSGDGTDNFTGDIRGGETLQIPAKENWLDALLRTIGEDAKIIVGIICDAPREIAEDIAPNKRGVARAAVRRHLVDRRGWSDARVDRAWREVEVAI